MSNYPPGVTGNEPIFGVGEADAEVVCGATNVTIYCVPEHIWREAVRNGKTELSRFYVEGIDLDVCPFSGEVTTVYGEWTCPMCGTIHEPPERDE